MRRPPAAPRKSTAILVVLGASLTLNVWQFSRAHSAVAAPVEPPAESRSATTNLPAPTATATDPAGVTAPSQPAPLPEAPRPAAPSLPSLPGELRSDPAYRAFALSKQRTTVITRYTDLLRRLGLDDSVRDKLRDALADERARIQELMLTAHGEGRDAQTLGPEVAAIKKQADDAIRSLLTPEQQAQYTAYRDSLSARSQADELDTRLGYTSQPLSPEKKEALVRILNESVAELDLRGSALYRARTSLGETYPLPLTDAVLAKAKSVLTPHQLSVLMEMALTEMDKGEIDRKIIYAQKNRG